MYHTLLRANRVGTRLVSWDQAHSTGRDELSLVGEQRKKELEKMDNYGPLRFELSRRYPGYKIVQLNVTIDVLGGWSKYVKVQ